MKWKYTDNTNNVVYRINEDGSRESCLVSVIQDWITAGNTPDPAYTQAELDDKAAQEAKILSIENTLSTKLPSLDSIQKEIDALKEIEEVKTFLKKLAEVVYVHIKNDNV